ncbi:glucosaminyl-phosphatidylinositol-acyltransferase PIGW-like [Babylonia areolata]|uniref:glucosaminyl-phosphatidylinositol- acyltransferase PIGW-like n=1 Tax=Babylonia areolata TaxID=304850 RepID=UPI003FD5B2B5
MSTMSSYKQEHEKFVSGHNGTTVTEVALMTIAPCACLLHRDILLLVYGLYSMPFWPRVIFDFSIIIVPAILMNTVLSHVTTTACLVLFISAATCCLLALLSTDRSSIGRDLSHIITMEMEPQRPFLNYTRSLMNVSTAIVILGVDFAVFPRRFAKTETFGTGYMDIGVGCFVISNALVSPEARGKSQLCQSLKEFLQRVTKSLKSSSPLLVFGLGRLLAVKGTDYHEHVSEYGVHWNFFFTLAVVKLLSTVALCLCPVKLSCALAVAIMSVYQYALSHKGLADYILHGVDGQGSRQGLLDANREGVLSSLGYMALYLIGVQLGSLLFSKNVQTFREWVRKLWVLVVISLGGYVCQSLVSSLMQPTSRRMANLAFVFWIVGLSVQVMWSCLAVDLISTALSALYFAHRKKTDLPKEEKQMLSDQKMRSEVPCLLKAVNTNGLFYFLLANILTGLINMAIPTLYASATVAVAILLAYTFFLSVVIVYMDKKKIYTRFW